MSLTAIKIVNPATGGCAFEGKIAPTVTIHYDGKSFFLNLGTLPRVPRPGSEITSEANIPVGVTFYATIQFPGRPLMTSNTAVTQPLRVSGNPSSTPNIVTMHGVTPTECTVTVSSGTLGGGGPVADVVTRMRSALGCCPTVKILRPVVIRL